MLEKLNAITRHYEQLGEELLNVGADYQRAAQINKERTDLETIVARSREYARALQSLEEARPHSLIGSSRPIRNFARLPRPTSLR